MHISINPTANNEVRNPNWNCCPCQSKLCVAYDPPPRTRTYMVSHSTMFPKSSQWRWEKLNNTKQSKCRGTRHGQETHSSHEHVLRRTTIPTGLLLCRPRTGWRSNQSPCLRGTRSWGKRSSMRDVHTHPKPRWRASGTAAGQGQKEEPHQKTTQASRLLGGCWKM